jgi:hypothetical protein
MDINTKRLGLCAKENEDRGRRRKENFEKDVRGEGGGRERERKKKRRGREVKGTGRDNEGRKGHTCALILDRSSGSNCIISSQVLAAASPLMNRGIIFRKEGYSERKEGRERMRMRRGEGTMLFREKGKVCLPSVRPTHPFGFSVPSFRLHSCLSVLPSFPCPSVLQEGKK